jgi:hypothetical protein
MELHHGAIQLALRHKKRRILFLLRGWFRCAADGLITEHIPRIRMILVMEVAAAMLQCYAFRPT